jgi:PTH1 family peptidyl-tRNA hydrolase
LIVGLGNPGPAYEATRHNLGFMVADALASLLGARSWSPFPAFAMARAEEQGRIIHIVKPLLFMNLSGTAVREALAMTGTATERTLIVVDDFQIPLAALRIRPAGSDGGHRGLGSVIASLGTEVIPRLRCGIGGENLPPPAMRRDFVLGKFAKEESAAAREMVLRAAEAARTFAVSGIQRAMTSYNTP